MIGLNLLIAYMIEIYKIKTYYCIKIVKAFCMELILVSGAIAITISKAFHSTNHYILVYGLLIINFILQNFSDQS